MIPLASIQDFATDVPGKVFRSDPLALHILQSLAARTHGEDLVFIARALAGGDHKEALEVFVQRELSHLNTYDESNESIHSQHAFAAAFVNVFPPDDPLMCCPEFLFTMLELSRRTHSIQMRRPRKKERKKSRKQGEEIL